MATITMIGAGQMASALSFPASDNGHEVRIAGTPLDKVVIETLNERNYHMNLKRTLPEGIKFYYEDKIGEAVKGTDLVICGVSSFGVDWFSDAVVEQIPNGVPVLSVTKGMVNACGGKLISFPDYLKSKHKNVSFSAIGGPCTSYELADRNQSCVAFCGENMEHLKWFKSVLSTCYYHVSLSTDVFGLELSVAAKNAYAFGVCLAVGLAKLRKTETLEYNPQAALFGQATKEMCKLLKVFGGGSENIAYFCGDLYVTIFGGRTRLIGTLLGKGIPFKDAIKELSGATLESVVIAKRIYTALEALSDKGIVSLKDFPLICHVNEIIEHDKKVNIPWNMFLE